MTDENEHVGLRLVESGPPDGGGEVSFHLEASIKVGGFSGNCAFFVREEIIMEFAHQLDGLINRMAPTAKLECGLVAGRTDVVYFVCQVDRTDVDDHFIVQASRDGRI